MSRNFIKLRFLLLIHIPVKEIGIGLGIHPIWDFGLRIADCLDFQIGDRLDFILRLGILIEE